MHVGRALEVQVSGGITADTQASLIGVQHGHWRGRVLAPQSTG